MSTSPDPIRTAGPEALGESRTPHEAREIASGVHFLAGFGNTTIILGSHGAAVIDPGLFTNGPRVVEELRRLTDLPVRYVIYTHGHYDHAFGTPSHSRSLTRPGRRRSATSSRRPSDSNLSSAPNSSHTMSNANTRSSPRLNLDLL